MLRNTRQPLILSSLLGHLHTSLTSSALANGFSSAGREGKDVMLIDELANR